MAAKAGGKDAKAMVDVFLAERQRTQSAERYKSRFMILTSRSPGSDDHSPNQYSQEEADGIR